MGKKKRRLRSAVVKLIKEQGEDMNRRDWIDNDFNPDGDDFYDRRRRTKGPGYKKK